MTTSPKYIVNPGQVYGRFTVLDPDVRHKSGNRAARCRCECGHERVVLIYNLCSGKSQSCGCARPGAPIRFTVSSGQVFGRLTVLDPDAHNPGGARAAACRCSCGQETMVTVYQLLEGHTRSCGCLRHDARRTHGMSKHPLYQTWNLMIDRCENPQSGNYPDWGGRGIRVCPEWHDVTVFISWIEANLGPRPEGLTIDRIDANGDYEPGNVQWADREWQAFNTRTRRADALGRSLAERRALARNLEQRGRTQLEIAEVLGVSQQSISNYLAQGR